MGRTKADVCQAAHSHLAAPTGKVREPGIKLHLRPREQVVSLAVHGLRELHAGAIPRWVASLTAQEAADYECVEFAELPE